MANLTLQSAKVRGAINKFLNDLFRNIAQTEGGDRYFDKDYAAYIPEARTYDLQLALVKLARELEAESEEHFESKKIKLKKPVLEEDNA